MNTTQHGIYSLKTIITMNTQNRVWNLYAISYSYNKYYYGIMLSVGTYYYVGLYFQSYINLLC